MRWYDRLRRSSEIAQVRRRGRHAGLVNLTAYALEDRRGPTRVAVSVAKSVGGAVTRNLVRRRIRGALEAMPPPPVALRLLIVAKPAAAVSSFERLSADVATAVARLGTPGPPPR